ncbi:MAG TPA: ribonuclease P protein component, partial [Gammaproteobacteria bacterium]
AARNGMDTARLGLAVSRKVSSLAVARNRIKRQARESFRHHQAELPAIDIVVMAKRDAVNATAAELQRSLAKHWQKLARQCDKS